MRLFVGDGRLLDACLRRGWTELVFGSQRAVCEGWRSALNPKLSKRRLELRLGLVPGGARRYPVRIELPQASGEIGWAINAAMFNRPPRLVLGLGHDGTGPVTGIVRLDIWRPGDYKFHRSFKRPLVGPPLETNFPIPPLERGSTCMPLA